MKTKEELNALKEKVETLNAKLAELSEDELALVTGGASGSVDSLRATGDAEFIDPEFIDPNELNQKAVYENNYIPK